MRGVFYGTAPTAVYTRLAAGRLTLVVAEGSMVNNTNRAHQPLFSSIYREVHEGLTVNISRLNTVYVPGAWGYEGHFNTYLVLPGYWGSWYFYCFVVM